MLHTLLSPLLVSLGRPIFIKIISNLHSVDSFRHRERFTVKTTTTEELNLYGLLKFFILISRYGGLQYQYYFCFHHNIPGVCNIPRKQIVVSRMTSGLTGCGMRDTRKFKTAGYVISVMAKAEYAYCGMKYSKSGVFSDFDS